jgi:hypothetical protein
MPIKADIELNAGAKTFESGLLVELIAANVVPARATRGCG